MSKKGELAGQKFGRLLVLYETGERKNRHVVWHCRCDCGNEVDIIGCSLTSGNTTSCGCYQRERTAEAHIVHGMVKQGERHPVYNAWAHMLQRCENPSHKQYKDYGGRGITVCAEWHDAAVFINWALANGWEKGLQLDRIDNDKGYSHSNCHWVTRKENNRNKRSNHLIAFDGKTQTIAEWAEETGIRIGTLWARVNQYHWLVERALTEPVRRVGYVS